MRPRWIALWSAAILVGAALIKPISDSVSIVAWMASYEVVHIVAHLFLYGSLMAIALRAGLSEGRAALLTLLIAVMQEGIQVVTAGRAPGLPELFDIGVDSVAIVAVVLVTRHRRRAPA
ncbi:MAG: hypothetical protein HOV80_03090 [Polyangiaceae bacterium]|nr:hypothetical protein [Polyangiaceae bacterium]